MTGRRARTACPLDCPDGCTLEVTVEDGRLTAVDAAPPGAGTNPFTQGWICRKVRHHADRVYAPERVLRPLVRTGPKGEGAFAETTWDEALGLVVDRVQEAIERSGPAAVVPYLYSSSAGKLARRALSPLVWQALGVSEVARTICASTATAAWELTFGSMPGADLHHVEQADLVLVWGANPAVSNTHLLPLLARARRRGAAVVVVDPRRTGAAARADLHLAVRPGTDVVLAQALVRMVEERDGLATDFLAAHAAGVAEHLAACRGRSPAEAAATCGVDEASLAAAADLLVERRRVFFRLGFGLERSRQGGAAHRAVLALAVSVGAFGEPGAGVHLDAGDSPFDGGAIARAVLGGPPPAPARVLNMNRIGPDLCDPSLEPPIEVLFVQGANPAVTAPDQRAVLAGLARDDLFTVVHDQVLTDTALLADVVLPATTHFEAGDVQLPYGTFTSDQFAPVIERVGESRSNDEVAAALAERLGLPGFDPEPRRLAALGLAGSPDRAPGRVQFRDVFPTTADARAQLVVANLAEVDPLPTYRPSGDDRYPLVLLSPATSRTVNSMFAEFDPPDAVVHLHPDDAAARGVGDGDPVIVGNDLAELRLPARLDPALRPGVATIPKGLWRRHVVGGLTANALVAAELSDLGAGAVFNETRVQVRPASAGR